jgi:hypothetical protein
MLRTQRISACRLFWVLSMALHDCTQREKRLSVEGVASKNATVANWIAANRRKHRRPHQLEEPDDHALIDIRLRSGNLAGAKREPSATGAASGAPGVKSKSHDLHQK